MLTAALALLDDLETAIAAEACQPDVSRVTAGEPAAPNPGCQDLAVWIADVQDDAAFTTPGPQPVRSKLRLSYRIGWCYQESAEGPSEAEELDAATCLYNLMEAVWCYLVANRSTLVLSGLCNVTTLEPLIVQPRSGGWVSAQGSVVVDYDCAAS